MAAVDKLGYTPDASARKMRGMRNQLIALSSPIRGDINKARYNATFCTPHGPQGTLAMT